MANVFERIIEPRSRPGYRVAPMAITWDAVAFRLEGPRQGVACIPRSALESFVDDLDGGRLDASIREFLASAPTGRVLRNADQAKEPGLFDALADVTAIAPPEREPGRPTAFGRGDGTPTGPRRDKRERPRGRPARLLIGAAIAGAVIVAGAVAYAATRGGDSHTAVAATATAAPGGAGAPTSTAATAPPTTAPIGNDLHVDVLAGAIQTVGNICGATGQGHFDLSGTIVEEGVTLVESGGVDVTVGPDGTGSFTGQITSTANSDPPISFTLQIGGSVKINRFEGTRAELEVLGSAGGGTLSGGGVTLTLPPSGSDPTHQAFPATAGTFC